MIAPTHSSIGSELVPLSSQTARLYPAETLVMLNEHQRKAMADQLTTASKDRLLRRLGILSSGEIEAVNRVVRLQLGL